MNNEFPVEQIRQCFPIIKRRIGEHDLIYFDNAATTQKPQRVVDASSKFYTEHNANVHRGIHRLSMEATELYEGARRKIQKFINAEKAEEIVFVRGTTEAINLVAQSYLRPILKPQDEILLTEMEHHANIVPWFMLAKQMNAKLKVVPINSKGELDMDKFHQMLSERTKMVSVTMVSNALGTINTVSDMVEAAHARNIPVLIDGAQATPHMAVDVKKLDCEFFAFSSHKMYGPTGVGALYAKESLLNSMTPYQGGGDMIHAVSFDEITYAPIPQKFEAGTQAIAEAIAFGTAIDFLNDIGIEKIQAYEKTLLTHAENCALNIPDIRLIGQAEHKASIFSFVMEGIHPHDVGTWLDQRGIAIRAGHHCAMPVMKAFDIPATARASFAIYNTTEEIDVMFNALDEVRAAFK